VAQLCGLGLAPLLRAKSGSSMTTTPDHTGTMSYLAHELVRSRENAIPTKATDAYVLSLALGACRFGILPLAPHGHGDV